VIKEVFPVSIQAGEAVTYVLGEILERFDEDGNLSFDEYAKECLDSYLGALMLYSEDDEYDLLDDMDEDEMIDSILEDSWLMRASKVAKSSIARSGEVDHIVHQMFG
jgi:hypothetical protein